MNCALRHAATVSIVGMAALLLLLGGCGEKKERKKPVQLFSERPEKIDYASIKVDKPNIQAMAPIADTWAGRTKETVAAINKDLQQCRNEFMVPFQFRKMRRRNVEWLKISAMDAVCRDGDAARKKRGPWKRIVWLAKEQIGKQPDLDQFIAMAADHIEHTRLVSLMAKKIGAPKIELITKTAKDGRDQVIRIGLQLDKIAARIGEWSNDLAPLDDANVMAAAVDATQFKALLARRYAPFLDDTLAAYDRYASESWQYPKLIKFRSLRLFSEILTRYLQQDRARVDKITGGDDKTQEGFEAYLAAVEGVTRAWTSSYARFMKDKSGTWTDVDPFRPPLAKAQQAWGAAHDKLFGTKKRKELKAAYRAWKKADRKRRRGKTGGPKVMRF